jgi:hypothetical protein
VGCKRFQSTGCMEALAVCTRVRQDLSCSETMGKPWATERPRPLDVSIQARSLHVHSSSFPRLFAHGLCAEADIGEESSNAAAKRVRIARCAPCHRPRSVPQAGHDQAAYFVACGFCGCPCSSALANDRQHLRALDAPAVNERTTQRSSFCSVSRSQNHAAPGPFIKLQPTWACCDKVPWASDTDVRSELI